MDCGDVPNSGSIEMCGFFRRCHLDAVWWMGWIPVSQYWLSLRLETKLETTFDGHWNDSLKHGALFAYFA